MGRLGALIAGVILLELGSIFLWFATNIEENCAGSSRWQCSDFLSDLALAGMVGGALALTAAAVIAAARAGRR